ncbi:hypothetical protein HY408_00990 [Candidatus Gottesmanbacteria bacterium]|nr:hypothetical protein [Candidatus Gottesmanbacteria bacterium]
MVSFKELGRRTLEAVLTPWYMAGVVTFPSLPTVKTARSGLNHSVAKLFVSLKNHRFFVFVPSGGEVLAVWSQRKLLIADMSPTSTHDGRLRITLDGVSLPDINVIGRPQIMEGAAEVKAVYFGYETISDDTNIEIQAELIQQFDLSPVTMSLPQRRRRKVQK